MCGVFFWGGGESKEIFRNDWHENEYGIKTKTREDLETSSQAWVKS